MDFVVTSHRFQKINGQSHVRFAVIFADCRPADAQEITDSVSTSTTSLVPVTVPNDSHRFTLDTMCHVDSVCGWAHRCKEWRGGVRAESRAIPMPAYITWVVTVGVGRYCDHDSSRRGGKSNSDVDGPKSVRVRTDAHHDASLVGMYPSLCAADLLQIHFHPLPSIICARFFIRTHTHTDNNYASHTHIK